MSDSPESRALPPQLMWGIDESRPSDQMLELSDEELFARLQAGDSSVLQILFDRYSRLVLHAALRVLHDQGEAEEIVQEVFLYVYQRCQLFDATKGVAKAWIVQIAYHRALDRRAYLGRRGYYLGTEIDPLMDNLMGEADLERELGQKRMRAELVEAFRLLPEDQRRTLELYYFEGLELREISERLNESLGNVRHHYYRALERLRRSGIVRKLREK